MDRRLCAKFYGKPLDIRGCLWKGQAYCPRAVFTDESRTRAFMRTDQAYFLTVGAIFLGCMVPFGVFVLNRASPIALVQFGLLIFFTFSFSMSFTKRLFSLFVKPFRLARLDHAMGATVALLYTTMNDVVPECLGRIQQDYPVNVFVLDDSTDLEKRRIVDEMSLARGFTVLRRDHRTGYKAGAINDWLGRYGSRHDYFVLLDADSIIPRDWVSECVRYAEHPENRMIAVFQGLINIWNLDNRFTKTLAPIHRISQDEWEKKMANYLDTVLFYGHNALLRTRPILQVGGFPTEYVSEDFALAVRLANHGYHCRFVPLHTYEALPENVRGFVKRQNKWTRGAMEFFEFARSSRISAARKLTLLEVPLGHISYVCILAATLIAVYGRNSSWGSALGFSSSLLASPLTFIWSIPLFRYTITLGMISAMVLALKLVQVRLSPILYWRYQVLSRSIGAIMLPHELKSILYYAFDRGRRFPVTPKGEPPLAWRDVILVGWMTILFTFAFFLGIGLANPVGLFYNIGWLAPFAIAPFTIYYFSKQYDRVGSGSSLDPLLATCLQDPLGGLGSSELDSKLNKLHEGPVKSDPAPAT